MMYQNQVSGATSYGRNGTIKTYGLDVYCWLDSAPERRRVLLTPIRKNGMLGKCDIEIPASDVPALIEALQKVTKEKT